MRMWRFAAGAGPAEGGGGKPPGFMDGFLACIQHALLPLKRCGGSEGFAPAAGPLTGLLAGWLAGLLAGWLAGWLGLHLVA